MSPYLVPPCEELTGGIILKSNELIAILCLPVGCDLCSPVRDSASSSSKR
jgi:hypothetical protein